MAGTILFLFALFSIPLIVYFSLYNISAPFRKQKIDHPYAHGFIIGLAYGGLISGLCVLGLLKIDKIGGEGALVVAGILFLYGFSVIIFPVLGMIINHVMFYIVPKSALEKPADSKQVQELSPDDFIHILVNRTIEKLETDKVDAKPLRHVQGKVFSSPAAKVDELRTIMRDMQHQEHVSTSIKSDISMIMVYLNQAFPETGRKKKDVQSSEA